MISQHLTSLKQRVRITVVNPSTRTVQGLLRDGGTVSVTVYETPGAFVWPVVGEQWTVARQSGVWLLGSRIEGLDDTHSIEALAPGASRIDADTVVNRSGDRFLTVDDITSVTVQSESPVNAKDPRFGAVGDGSADDTAALNAFHTHVASAARGGEGIIPAGHYKVSNTPFPVATNNQKGYAIGGEGMGGSTPSRTTLIERTADFPVLSAVGTGVTTTTTAQGLTLRDLSIHGGAGLGFTTDLVSLLRCATWTFERVRLAKADSRLLYAEQLWNSSFERCIFEEGGNLAAARPATLLTDSAADATNTVDFIGCQWEANLYDALVLDGTILPCASVKVLGGKFERNGGHEMHFKNAQQCRLIGVFLYGTNVNDVVMVTSGNGNVLMGNQIESSNASTSNYLVNLAGGLRTVVMGNGLVNATPKAAHVFINAAITDVTVFGNGHQGTVTNRINDSRTVKDLGFIGSSGRLLAYNGLGTREINTTGLTSAQIDALFTTHTPVNGQIASDPTNGLLVVRQGGKWYKTAALTQIP
jgi:hypothetical protein